MIFGWAVGRKMSFVIKAGEPAQKAGRTLGEDIKGVS